MKKVTITLMTMLMGLSAFSKDVLTLIDQQSFQGKIIKIKNCQVKFKADGITYFIPVEDIYSIQFENPKDAVKYEALENNDPNKCMKGKTDAELYHGKVGGHVVLGMLFGVFAVGGAALGNPKPQNGRETYEMSKNKEMFNDPEYLSCYKRKARGRNTGNAAIGWGLGTALLLLLL